MSHKYEFMWKQSTRGTLYFRNKKGRDTLREINRRNHLRPKVYSRFVLIILLVVYLFNYIDRQILSILAEDIKADLGLSDGDLGFLYGTAFAIFYAIFGIPLARLADNWHRTRLISIGLAFWSLMTAFSGGAKGFMSLALFRFGVGIGEATANPAAYSLLYDYFPAKVRTTVVGIYSTGVYIGMGIGLFLGGWILDFWNGRWPDISNAPFGLQGWQAAFMAVGFPGLILAILVSMLKEPVRGAMDGLEQPDVNYPNPVKVLRNELLPMIPLVNLWILKISGASRYSLFLNIGVGTVIFFLALALINLTGQAMEWITLSVGGYCVFSWIQALLFRDPVCFNLLVRSPTMRYLYVSNALSTFTGASIVFWIVPFFQRYHDVAAADVGLTVGLSIAVAGVVGMVLGGVLADRLINYDRRGKLFVCVIGYSLSTIAAFLLLNSGETNFAYICCFLYFLVQPIATAPVVATINDLVIPRMRAIASALNMMFVTFIGFALGPYFVGVMSDQFFESGLGDGEALRQALMIGIAPQIVGVILMVVATKTFIDDENSVLLRARLYGEKI